MMLNWIRGACLALVTLAPSAALAGEGYFYAGDRPATYSIYLIGGEYELYAHAKTRHTIANPDGRACSFIGTLASLSPSAGMVVSFGTSTLLETPIGYTSDRTFQLAPGVYALHVDPPTDCIWNVSLIGTANNAAGLAPVQASRIVNGTPQRTTILTEHDTVRFFAQYRTNHNAISTFSGTLKIVSGGRVTGTFPLAAGRDDFSKSDVLGAMVWFAPGPNLSAGPLVVTMTVKFGETDLTSTGEFTMTP